MNTTSDATQSGCYLMLFTKDPIVMALNVIKFVALLLYLVWIIISFKVKEFHSRHMILLYNLNAVGIFYLAYGLTFTFYSSCFVPTQAICLIQAILNFFTAYNNGYAIAAVAVHRMVFVYFVDIQRFLTIPVLMTIVFSLWILPLCFTSVHLLVFKYVYFTGFASKSGLCLIRIPNQTHFLAFFGVFGFIIPNALIICGYILSYIKLKSRARASNSTKMVQSRRLTIQIVLHVIMYEIDLASSLFLFNIAPQGQLPVFANILPIFRIFKWFNNFSPLCMMYFHPVMIQKFKELFNKNESRVKNNSTQLSELSRKPNIDRSISKNI
jgi:hypothetical protein